MTDAPENQQNPQTSSDPTPDNPLKKLKKPRKSRKGSSLKQINIDRVNKKLMNILDRDTNHLLAFSRIGELTKDQSNSLVNYLKLVKNLQKEDAQLSENLSDEELERIAAKG